MAFLSYILGKVIEIMMTISHFSTISKRSLTLVIKYYSFWGQLNFIISTCRCSAFICFCVHQQIKVSISCNFLLFYNVMSCSLWRRYSLCCIVSYWLWRSENCLFYIKSHKTEWYWVASSFTCHSRYFTWFRNWNAEDFFIW